MPGVVSGFCALQRERTNDVGRLLTLTTSYLSVNVSWSKRARSHSQGAEFLAVAVWINASLVVCCCEAAGLPLLLGHGLRHSLASNRWEMTLDAMCDASDLPFCCFTPVKLNGTLAAFRTIGLESTDSSSSLPMVAAFALLHPGCGLYISAGFRVLTDLFACETLPSLQLSIPGPIAGSLFERPGLANHLYRPVTGDRSRSATSKSFAHTYPANGPTGSGRSLGTREFFFKVHSAKYASSKESSRMVVDNPKDFI